MMSAVPPPRDFHRLEHIVRVLLNLSCSSMMFAAELREEIGKAIPRVVECLKDSANSVCSAAVSVLSSLGAHCMCPSVSPLPGVINDAVSPIAQLNTECYIRSALLGHLSSFKPSGQCPCLPCRPVIASCYMENLFLIGTS